MTYASDEWMARFVLGFGSAVRVLEPRVAGAAGAGVGRCRADPPTRSVRTAPAGRLGPDVWR